MLIQRIAICEDFIEFIDCHKENYDDFTQEPVLSGDVLAKTVLSTLNKYGLDLQNCVAIGTDGCSVMTGEVKGAVTELKGTLKGAIRSPCYSHALNLSISKCSTVQAVRNAIGTIKEIIAFFNASSKRNNVLKSINNLSLINLCETRWLERHEAVMRFQLNLIKIVEALDLISQWKERDSSTKATLLKNSITTPLFLVTLHALSEILSATITLSRVLQTKSLDKQLAKNIINNTKKILNDKRKNADSVFRKIFDDTTKMMLTLGTEMTLPRITARQTNRPNAKAESAEAYYRVNIFIPLLDSIIEDLNDRFTDEILNVFELNVLVPNIILEKTQSDLHLLNDSVNSILDYMMKVNPMNDIDILSMNLKSELLFWSEYWKQKSTKIPDCALSALKECSKEIYPTINMLLQILCTIPVTVASAERSFSSLKRLKSWLRSTMSQEKLSGLALLHIHRDINVYVENVIDKFGKVKERKLEFVI